jgi:hypothetical protein
VGQLWSVTSRTDVNPADPVPARIGCTPRHPLLGYVDHGTGGAGEPVADLLSGHLDDHECDRPGKDA